MLLEDFIDGIPHKGIKISHSHTGDRVVEVTDWCCSNIEQVIRENVEVLNAFKTVLQAVFTEYTDTIEEVINSQLESVRDDINTRLTHGYCRSIYDMVKGRLPSIYREYDEHNLRPDRQVPKNLFLVWLGDNTVPPYHLLTQKIRDIRRLYSKGWRIYVVCEESNIRLRHYFAAVAPYIVLLNPESVIVAPEVSTIEVVPMPGNEEEVKEKLRSWLKDLYRYVKFKRLPKEEEAINLVMEKYYPIYLRCLGRRSDQALLKVYYYLMEIREYQPVSDVLKYCCLYRYGGVYMDWDVSIRNVPRLLYLMNTDCACRIIESGAVGVDVLVAKVNANLLKELLLQLSYFKPECFLGIPLVRWLYRMNFPERYDARERIAKCKMIYRDTLYHQYKQSVAPTNIGTISDYEFNTLRIVSILNVSSSNFFLKYVRDLGEEKTIKKEWNTNLDYFFNSLTTESTWTGVDNYVALLDTQEKAAIRTVRSKLTDWKGRWSKLDEEERILRENNYRDNVLLRKKEWRDRNATKIQSLWRSHKERMEILDDAVTEERIRESYRQNVREWRRCGTTRIQTLWSEYPHGPIRYGGGGGGWSGEE